MMPQSGLYTRSIVLLLTKTGRKTAVSPAPALSMGAGVFFHFPQTPAPIAGHGPRRTERLPPEKFRAASCKGRLSLKSFKWEKRRTLIPFLPENGGACSSNSGKSFSSPGGPAPFHARKKCTLEDSEAFAAPALPRKMGQISFAPLKRPPKLNIMSGFRY